MSSKRSTAEQVDCKFDCPLFARSGLLYAMEVIEEEEVVSRISRLITIIFL